MPDAFDESKASWSEEYQELKDLLTKEEYAAARESTLNAHYTQPVIIESMYQVIQNLGFEKGNILEPSMGVGNFLEGSRTSYSSPGFMEWNWIASAAGSQNCFIRTLISRSKDLKRPIIPMTF